MSLTHTVSRHTMRHDTGAQAPRPDTRDLRTSARSRSAFELCLYVYGACPGAPLGASRPRAHTHDRQPVRRSGTAQSARACLAGGSGALHPHTLTSCTQHAHEHALASRPAALVHARHPLAGPLSLIPFMPPDRPPRRLFATSREQQRPHRRVGPMQQLGSARRRLKRRPPRATRLGE